MAGYDINVSRELLPGLLGGRAGEIGRNGFEPGVGGAGDKRWVLRDTNARRSGKATAMATGRGR